MLLQQFHDFSIELRRRWLRFGGPVIDVPVVADTIDELVIDGGLLSREFLQVFFHEGAQQQIVLQHAAFARLIQQAAVKGNININGCISRISGIATAVCVYRVAHLVAEGIVGSASARAPRSRSPQRALCIVFCPDRFGWCQQSAWELPAAAAHGVQLWSTVSSIINTFST